MPTSEYIEEVIEQSYLLGLNEHEIQANLEQFIETCGRVIREHVHDKKQMEALAGKLAKARALSLIEDRAEGEGAGGGTAPREDLAERVARNKRLILRAIGECDPALVEKIDRSRFPDRATAPQPSQTQPVTLPQKGRPLLGKVGLLAGILVGLLFAYLILLQYV